MILTAEWMLPIEGQAQVHGAVRVDGDRIAGVGTIEELKKNYPNDEILDFGKAAVLPGFVDLHTHLEYSVFRGLCDDVPFGDWRIQLTEKSKLFGHDEWGAAAELGAVEAARSGITCLADISPTGASLAAAEKSGLRAVIYYEIVGMDSREVNELMTKASREAGAWRDNLGDPDRIRIGLGPHSSYTTAPPLFQAVSKHALAEGYPVSYHLAGSREEYEFVKYAASKLATEFPSAAGFSDGLWQPTGVSPVKYLEQWDAFDGDVLAVHCVQVNDADIKILKKNDVAVAHCPKCNAKLGMGIAPLNAFLSEELRVGIGTDSPASNNTMDIFDEMRVGLMLQRGVTKDVTNLSAQRFVKMATLGGAEALGLADQIGTLEPGKKADIIVVDLSQSHHASSGHPYSALVYTANQEDVILSMVDGKIVYHDGQFKTLDIGDIFKRMEPLREKLLSV